MLLARLLGAYLGEIVEFLARFRHRVFIRYHRMQLLWSAKGNY
jgi:hypothetical protein